MRTFVLFSLLFLISGCVVPGQGLYVNDPLTGGVDSRSSALIHIPLPSGLQYYPSHSRISGGDRKEGLETFRGYVDPASCASSFYSNFRQAGWNLRLREQAGNRAAYVYQKGDEMAVLIFQAQGMLTIVQIWAGSRLADDAALDPGDLRSGESWTSLPGESWPPAGSAQQGTEEKWGLEERDL